MLYPIVKVLLVEEFENGRYVFLIVTSNHRLFLFEDMPPLNRSVIKFLEDPEKPKYFVRVWKSKVKKTKGQRLMEIARENSIRRAGKGEATRPLCELEKADVVELLLG